MVSYISTPKFTLRFFFIKFKKLYFSIAQPDGDSLEFNSNDSDYESMESVNTTEQILTSPERIVQATEEQPPLFPSKPFSFKFQ